MNIEQIIKVFGQLPATFAAIRGRIEGVEKQGETFVTRFEAMETKLAALQPLADLLAKFDVADLTTELEALGAKASTSTSDPVAAVQAAVPDADPAHVQAAVDAHKDAVAQGTDPVNAATVAAMNAGAQPDTASAIAAAIPAPQPAAPASTDTTMQTGGLPGALPASV